MRIITWEDGGTTYHQYKRAFRVRAPDFLVYLRKTRMLSGAQVLRLAERFVRDRLGGTRLTLQDASFITCDDRRTEFDLGFRSLLAHGRTWYERQGYAPSGKGAAAVRRRVAVAVATYAAFPVRRVAEAVAAQMRHLRSTKNATWTRVDVGVFTSASTAQPAKASRARVLRARAQLLTQLSSAPPGATLGRWLLTLTCSHYAAFMRAMYGTRMGDTSITVAETGGVRTPTITLFKRANAMRRLSHRILWIKCFACSKT
jgi:hypothetical protein